MGRYALMIRECEVVYSETEMESELSVLGDVGGPRSAVPVGKSDAVSASITYSSSTGCLNPTY